MRKTAFFPFILIIFSVFIAFKNYTPGTYLSGWDTLHPEFNLSLYWERTFGGAWQEHQGLGAVASQSHASELIRLPILAILKTLFGMSQVRYLYMFLMLVIGPVGVYTFVYKSLLRNKDFWERSVGAFCAGLFYLLNLSTVQNFYVPLEMFATQFGFLGWLFYSASEFVETGNKKWLLAFGLFNLFSAPQSHTPTLFAAYLGCFLLFCFGRFWVERTKGNAKKLGVLVAVTFLVNSFWIFPSAYFVATKSADVASSKIHQLFSEEAFLQNKQFGNIEDFALLRGFLFNWGEHTGGGQFGELLDEWIAHEDNFLVSSIGYTLFASILVGLLASVLRKENYSLPMLLIFVAGLFFIIGENPPTGGLFSFLRDTFPIFKEAFRFPFTKFSILLSFAYSAFFGYFIFLLVRVAKELSATHVVYQISTLLITSVATLLLTYYMLPVFRGYMISPTMRVAIPERYFELFNYLDNQSSYGRVADFPIHSFWGWSFYDWEPVTRLGYQGAGFLWFGIKQPLLNREFDRWEPANEQYYKEMSYAIYSKNSELVASLLDKFQIKWLLLDRSVFSPNTDGDVVFVEDIEEIFNSIPNLSIARGFGDGLVLYQNSAEFAHTGVITAPKAVSARIGREYFDSAYALYGNYYLDSKSGVDFPFLRITNAFEALSSGWVESNKDSIAFNLSGGETSVVGRISSFLVSKEPGVVEFRDGSGVVLHREELPVGVSVIRVNGNIIDLAQHNAGENIGEVFLEQGNDQVLLESFRLEAPALEEIAGFSVLESCGEFGDMAAYTLEDYKGSFRLGARNMSACVTAPLSSLAPGLSVPNNSLIDVSARYTSTGGVAGDFCLLDSLTADCAGKYYHEGGNLRLYAAISPERTSDYYLRFFTKSPNLNETFISYSNIAVGVLSKVGESSFNFDSSSGQFLAGSSLTFSKYLSLGGEELANESAPFICSSGRREVDRDEVIFSRQGGVTYVADTQSVCDVFSLRSLDSSLGQVLEIESKNVSGLPMRLCMRNESTGRCDLYVSLPESEDFVTSYYIMPPYSNNTKYTLSLTNLVLGELGSENSLRYIGLAQFPYFYLKSIQVPAAGFDSGTKDTFVLNEAYDSGWIAFCGLGVCDALHTRINSWANGWVFDGQIPSNIKVVFWPQYLEYAGIIVTLASIILLIRMVKGKNPSP